MNEPRPQSEEKRPQWAPINTAPQDGSMVWLFRVGERPWDRPVVGFWDRSDESWPWAFIDVKEGRFDAYRQDEWGPTHWRAVEIPEPPK